jgi:hypothetical protein
MQSGSRQWKCEASTQRRNFVLSLASLLACAPFAAAQRVVPIINGATLRTASSGARIELTSATGLRGIDASGNILTQLTTDGVLSLKTAPSGARLEINASVGVAGYDAAGILRSQLTVDGLLKSYRLQSVDASYGSIWLDNDSYVKVSMGYAEAYLLLYPSVAKISSSNPYGAQDLTLSTNQTSAKILFKTAYYDLRAAISQYGLELQNAGAEPAAPSSGGICYVYGGAVKYISAGGTRTVLAPN